jgi:formate dehydrogenase major subunit
LEQALDSNKTEQNGIPVQIGTSAGESAKTVTGVTRREWFRAAAGGCVGLALGGLVDVAAVRASTQKLKLSDINEFTTSCNFCSCGCGMVASVREGKLIAMEGDFDQRLRLGSMAYLR